MYDMCRMQPKPYRMIIGMMYLVNVLIVSGRESSIMDYSNRFADSLAEDFNPGVEVRDVVKEDMILVQFSSDAPNASLRYWTTIDEANGRHILHAVIKYGDKEGKNIQKRSKTEKS